MDEAEKRRWVERNTFHCERLHGNVSPEACEENRRKPAGRLWLADHRPIPCGDCTVWPELCAGVERRRAGLQEDGMNERKKKTIVCRRCGRTREHHGRGLCMACYVWADKAGELHKYPPVRGKGGHPAKDAGQGPGREGSAASDAGQGPGREGSAASDAGGAVAPGAGGPGGATKHSGDAARDMLEIDISRVPGLREHLERSAGENFRGIEHEALVILRREMDAARLWANVQAAGPDASLTLPAGGAYVVRGPSGEILLWGSAIRAR